MLYEAIDHIHKFLQPFRDDIEAEGEQKIFPVLKRLKVEYDQVQALWSHQRAPMRVEKQVTGHNISIEARDARIKATGKKWIEYTGLSTAMFANMVHVGVRTEQT